MANKTAEEILEDLAPSHEDGDHEVCASNFSICQVCGRKEYFMNIAFHPCTHTAVSRWVPQKCDCHVGKDIAEASRQLYEATMEIINTTKAVFYVRGDTPIETADSFKETDRYCEIREELRQEQLAKARAFYGITVTEEEGSAE